MIIFMRYLLILILKKSPFKIKNVKSFRIGKINDINIPVYLLRIHLGENFKFHSNLEISRDKANMLPLSKNSEKLGFHHTCVCIINYRFSIFVVQQYMSIDKKVFYKLKMSQKVKNSTVQILRESFQIMI